MATQPSPTSLCSRPHHWQGRAIFVLSVFFCVHAATVNGAERSEGNLASQASNSSQLSSPKSEACAAGLSGEGYLNRRINLRLSPADGDQITKAFQINSLPEGEQSSKAFDLYVAAVVRGAAESDRVNILKSLARMTDRPLEPGEGWVAKGDMIMLPPRTFQTIARWGIKAHEFRHQVQVIEWKNAAFRLLNGDRGVHEAMEFDSVVGEWEFWHPVPLNVREAAIAVVTDEVPDSRTKQILLLSLHEAGQSLEEFLKIMRQNGRSGLKDWQP
jgi:hypothetical protein